MAFAGMNDRKPQTSRRLEHAGARGDRAAQLRNIVTEQRTESVRFKKIPLHIDDQQRDAPRIERQRIRLRFYNC